MPVFSAWVLFNSPFSSSFLGLFPLYRSTALLWAELFDSLVIVEQVISFIASSYYYQYSGSVISWSSSCLSFLFSLWLEIISLVCVSFVSPCFTYFSHLLILLNNTWPLLLNMFASRIMLVWDAVCSCLSWSKLRYLLCSSPVSVCYVHSFWGSFAYKFGWLMERSNFLSPFRWALWLFLRWIHQ